MPTTSRNRTIVWSIIVIAVLTNIAGYALDLYQRFWWFDKAIHAYSLFAITLPLTLWLYGVVLTGAHDHPPLFVLVVASIGLGIGGLWEVAEWGYDQMVAGDVIKGKFDTIIDLIMDTIGSILAGLVSIRMVQPAGK